MNKKLAAELDAEGTHTHSMHAGQGPFHEKKSVSLWNTPFLFSECSDLLHTLYKRDPKISQLEVENCLEK